MSKPDFLQQPFTTITTPAGDTVSRPIVPATLASLTNKVTTYGLVDSGSDFNVLPYSLGIRLGLDWEAAKPMGFVRGAIARTEGRGVLLGIAVGHLPVQTLIFLWLKTDDAPLLFGINDFFTEYEVCFFQARGIFEVTPRTNP